jgi:hypothetical protein
LIFLELILNLPLFSFIASKKIYSAVLAFIILLVNYFLTSFKGKYKRIFEEFENESLKNKRRYKMYITTYVILSFISLIVSVYFLVVK